MQVNYRMVLKKKLSLNYMRKFIWIFLLAGMVNLTGIAATIDPPKNSTIITLDQDVGQTVFVVVDLNLKSFKSQEVFVFRQYMSGKNIDLYKNLNQKSNYRFARDNL